MLGIDPKSPTREKIPNKKSAIDAYHAAIGYPILGGTRIYSRDNKYNTYLANNPTIVVTK